MNPDHPEPEGTEPFELIRRAVDGTATSGDFRALQKILRDDPEARREYLTYANLHAALGDGRIAPVPAGAGPSLKTSSRRRLLAWRPLAVTVVIMTGLVVFSWTRRGVAVEVVKTSGAVSDEWVAGKKIRLNHCTLVRGGVQMRLSSGVLLDVNAPMEMTLVNDMHVHVLSGRITADVGEEGKGFVMETPQARVVDLGTRFGVDASDAAMTSVLVFQGQVEVYEKGATLPVALLNTGEGLRIDNHRRTSRIVSVSGTDAANGWTATTPPAASALISAVRDSMAANDEAAKKWPSLRNFYRIVPGGMREGSLAFSDAADEWSDVPASLVGADQVRTFAVDGFNWFMKLTIEVTRPVELYVLVDQRNPVPEWVSADFTDTDETITLNFKPAHAKGQVAKRLPYSIWKRAVHTAGEVTLGAPYPNPPADKKSFSPNRMFGVAAKALP